MLPVTGWRSAYNARNAFVAVKRVQSQGAAYPVATNNPRLPRQVRARIAHVLCRRRRSSRWCGSREPATSVVTAPLAVMEEKCVVVAVRQREVTNRYPK